LRCSKSKIPPRFMSIQALASSLNLSVSTVSRALNGYHDVSARTRQRVQAQALKMHYAPNATAKRLVTGRTQSVMLLTTQHHGVFFDYGFSTLLVGLSNAAAQHGLTIHAIALPPGEEEISTLRSMIQSRHSDAFIVTRTRTNDARIALLQSMNQVFVAHGYCPDTAVATVDADQSSGFEHMCSALLEASHSCIGMINAAPEFTFSQLREQGVRRAISKYPASALHCVQAQLSAQAGYDAADQLLRTHHQLTALICATDAQALGAIAACRDAGLTVGRDIAVTGYGNTESSAFSQPALASIDPQLGLHSAQLMQVLVPRLAQQAKSDSAQFAARLLIPTVFANRASSGLTLSAEPVF
jgi:LacI family transcriptional regulator